MPHIDAIRFRKYKSFGEEYSTIPLKRMTVLIGRNNSGKSSCIDVIEALSDNEIFQRIQVEAQAYVTYNNSELDQLHISRINNNLLGKTCLFSISTAWTSSNKHFYLEPTSDTRHWFYHQGASNDSVFQSANTLLSAIDFIRLNAERDIPPETEDHSDNLSPNGDDATSLINHYLNNEGNNERLVQHDLLDALNKIMNPDAHFSGITVQKTRNKFWEVYLYENDVRYPLSKMGSGLKTIILVLLNLLIVSYKYYHSCIKDNTVVFAFEELENNLHPALQRRLFDYIDKFSQDHPNTYVFLTTHSHVPINMFADQKDAQILHITKENGKSAIQIVDDFITKSEVLNDLDVRASDLLQSNGIIWVEGPSDRIYIKRWIEIWEGDLCEGIDYQFLYYGGRLLSHYTADGSENQEEQVDENLIKILKINRNAVIVMDSDITEKRPDINKTKERIEEEFKQNNMLCWITVGKEIENYIPCQAINSAYGCDLSQCGLNKLFPTYIKKNAITKKEFGKGKVPFASEVVKHITVLDSTHVPESDLEQRMTELIKTIRGWTPDKSEPDTQSAQT